MTLKRRIALSISIGYSILFGLMIGIIYYSFYDFRRDEFRQGLKDKSLVTAHFIAKNPDFISGVPKFLQESDDGLYQEKILIFNQEKKLIYSTVKDQKVSWDRRLLNQLDIKKEVFIENSIPEHFGILIKIEGKSFYILTSADDIYGRSKLTFLGYTLLITYLISTVVVWLSSYYFAKKLLNPLDTLTQKITDITAHSLTEKLPEQTTQDEITILARSFNTMMGRINDVFQSQKDFTASASHEIRTPLTRMAFQLENLIHLELPQGKTRTTLSNVIQDVHQLSDLTRSLLLLSKFDKQNIRSIYEKERVDDILFVAFEQVQKSFPNLQLNFTISAEDLNDPQLTIHGIRSLLEIAFTNLLKNAATYSTRPYIEVTLQETLQEVKIDILSYGPLINMEEQLRLFEPFMRGHNAQSFPGSGLGLRIVKRIIEYHGGSVFYTAKAPDQNIFTLLFNRSQDPPTAPKTL